MFWKRKIHKRKWTNFLSFCRQQFVYFYSNIFLPQKWLFWANAGGAKGAANETTRARLVWCGIYDSNAEWSLNFLAPFVGRNLSGRVTRNITKSKSIKSYPDSSLETRLGIWSDWMLYLDDNIRLCWIFISQLYHSSLPCFIHWHCPTKRKYTCSSSKLVSVWNDLATSCADINSLFSFSQVLSRQRRRRLINTFVRRAGPDTTSTGTTWVRLGGGKLFWNCPLLKVPVTLVSDRTFPYFRLEGLVFHIWRFLFAVSFTTFEGIIIVMEFCGYRWEKLYTWMDFSHFWNCTLQEVYNFQA